MIGDAYDPATPLDFAKRLATRLDDNAVLSELRPYRHCSLSSASASTCTCNVILDYLLQEQLPKADKARKVDDQDYGDYFLRERGRSHV